MLVWSSHQFYACVYGHGAYGGQNPTTSPSHEANRCAPPRTSLVLATATRRSATPTWQSQHDILYCPTHHWVDLKEHVQFWVLPFYQKTFTLLRCAQFSRQGLLQMVTTKTAAFGFPINGTHSMDHPLCRQCSANRGLSLRCSQSELGEAHFKYVYLCKIM